MGSLRRALVAIYYAARCAADTPPTVVMYETRGLDDPTTYWRASYDLASRYAARHGHHFVMYTLPKGMPRLDACDGSRLGPYWGKAAAAVQASLDFPRSRFFLLLDSDAAVSTTATKTGDRWSDRNLAQILEATAGWPSSGSPILVNQADRTYWERRAPQNITKWRYLLNSGTFAWRGAKGAEFMKAFWRRASSYDTRGRNALGLDFTRAWPQDQYGLNAVANAKEWVHDIQVVPHPATYAADYATYKASVSLKHRPPWPCLSGLPRSRCVVDHYCQHAKHKLGLVDAAKREGVLGEGVILKHVRALPRRGKGGFWAACDR